MGYNVSSLPVPPRKVHKVLSEERFVRQELRGGVSKLRCRGGGEGCTALCYANAVLTRYLYPAEKYLCLIMVQMKMKLSVH